MAVPYVFPQRWIEYRLQDILTPLLAAKASLISLTSVPYQRSWVESLQEIQLKREVAGTSRIEGAEFTEGELEAALSESADQLHTRSQRQARAAIETYRWIGGLPDDRPVDVNLVSEIHRRMVSGADDDHCPPGQLRGKEENVTFGSPSHRGAEGGEETSRALTALCNAIEHDYRGHDPLVQALAAHYHFAAIHPFLDGNGRTARALEALLLQRAGLRDVLFIAMSNYYYDEKSSYLDTLARVRREGHELSSFLSFGLKGIEIQCRRLFTEIRTHLAKSVYRNLMHELFGRLQTPKKRVIAKRQLAILEHLLSADELDLESLRERLDPFYASLKVPTTALIRDLNALIHLGAVKVTSGKDWRTKLAARLDWPEKMSEKDFLQSLRTLPRAKSALPGI
jgi:Fic family protein